MKTKKIIAFLLKWNELWTLPLAILLFWFSPLILRFMDPTAASYDAGIFQVPLFGIIQFFVFTAMAWLYIKMVFPNAYRMLDDLFIKNNIKELTQWQKSKILLSLFFGFLFALVLLARVI